jgi:hypothetical protein
VIELVENLSPRISPIALHPINIIQQSLQACLVLHIQLTLITTTLGQVSPQLEASIL